MFKVEKMMQPILVVVGTFFLFYRDCALTDRSIYQYYLTLIFAV